MLRKALRGFRDNSDLEVQKRNNLRRKNCKEERAGSILKPGMWRLIRRPGLLPKNENKMLLKISKCRQEVRGIDDGLAVLKKNGSEITYARLLT